jgi:hypothetical protein
MQSLPAFHEGHVGSKARLRSSSVSARELFDAAKSSYQTSEHHPNAAEELTVHAQATVIPGC